MSAAHRIDTQDIQIQVTLGIVSGVEVRYRVLGPLEVWSDSQPLAVGAPKQQLVLAVLLLNANRVVSMDRLVDELWPGRLPPSTAANVRTYVSGIRTMLRAGRVQSPLVSGHGGYQLNVGPQQLDLTRYESHVAEAAAARSRQDPQAELVALEQAAALWRGAPLEGVPDSPSVAAFRVYLEEQQTALTEQRSRSLIELSRYSQAVRMLRQHVVEHPMREQGHYLLVLALHRSGATSAALAAYRTARETLVRELGIEPGPELVRLHQAVLSGSGERSPTADDPPPAPVRIRPAQLPAGIGVFVGREESLVTLDECVAAGVAPMVIVITGMPGVGKTALAVHWAHGAAAKFPDGQLHLNLRGHSADPPLEPADGLARALRALGFPDKQLPQSLDERSALYRSALAQRQMLVLLDNAANADQVRPLLPGGGGSLALITSRSDLAGLVALDGAERVRLGPLPAQDSLTLLARVLGDSRVRAEPDAAVELARLCGYLPLALRIAAADLAGQPGRTLAEAAAQLSADRLAHLEVPGDAPATVRARFEISYQAKACAVRRLFRLLGVVPGTDISPAAAAALADAPLSDTRRILADLTEAHLVLQVAPERFAMHDLLRVYAADRAEREDGPDGQAAALARLYHHYLSTVDRAAELLYPQVLRLTTPPSDRARAIEFTRDTEAATWLDTERDNLVAAVQRSAIQGPRWAAIRIADGLRAYFSMRMFTVDWAATAEAALAAAQADDDTPGESAIRLGLAWLNLRQSRHAQAAAHGRRALECSRRAGWREGEAAAQGLLGAASLVAGKLPAAGEHCLAALTLNRDQGNTGGQAVQLDNLCIIHLQLGNLVEATGYAAEALDFYRKTGSRVGEADTLINLGMCHHWRGEFEVARTHLVNALEIQRSIENRIGQAHALQALAMLHCDTGEVEQARQLGLQSLAAARELGHPRLEIGALQALGTTRLRLGRFRNAALAWRHALRLAHDLGESYGEAEALIGLSRALLGQGDSQRALAFAVGALNLARQAGYAVFEGDALTVLARIHRARGEPDLASSNAAKAIEVYRATGHRLAQARALADFT